MVTTERVVVRAGILSRYGRDIPLLRLSDVSFSRSFWEGLVGSGTLSIDSGGQRGRLVLVNLPHVEEVYATLYRLAEENAARLRGPADDSGYPR